MDRLVFDRVVANRVELREVLADAKLFEVLALNVGDGPSTNASLRVVVTNTLLATISEPVEDWIAKAVELRSRALPNDGGKLLALSAECLCFDSTYAV